MAKLASSSHLPVSGAVLSVLYSLPCTRTQWMAQLDFCAQGSGEVEAPVGYLHGLSGGVGSLGRGLGPQALACSSGTPLGFVPSDQGSDYVITYLTM